MGQARCSNNLARLLLDDGQLDLAEDAASRTIGLIPEKGNEYLVSQSNRLLGDMYHSKEEKEKAIHRFQKALEIASRFDRQEQLCWIHHSLANLFLDGRDFEDAQTHVEKAKLHTAESRYKLGRVMLLQATIWYRQSWLEEATAEALGALEIFEKLGATEVEICRDLLRMIDKAVKSKSSGSQR